MTWEASQPFSLLRQGSYLLNLKSSLVLGELPEGVRGYDSV